MPGTPGSLALAAATAVGFAALLSVDYHGPLGSGQVAGGDEYRVPRYPGGAAGTLVNPPAENRGLCRWGRSRVGR